MYHTEDNTGSDEASGVAHTSLVGGHIASKEHALGLKKAMAIVSDSNSYNESQGTS